MSGRPLMALLLAASVVRAEPPGAMPSDVAARPAPAAPVDAGDRAPSGAGQRVLLRQPGRWVATLRKGAEPKAVLTAARRAAGLADPAGGTERVLMGRLVQFDASDSVRRAAAGSADVEVVNPYFLDAESGLGAAVSDELIVRLRAGVEPAAYFGPAWPRARPLFINGPEYLLTLTNGAAAYVLGEAARHAADPRVEWVEPNLVVEARLNYQPNDLLFGDQWHHDHTGQNGARTNADVRTPQAWDLVRGGSNNVVIAILDNGVEWTHPDLVGNAFVNAGDNNSNGLDDDGNGVADDAIGYDFNLLTNSSLPATTNDNHGTSCAGMAAAVGHNNLGVAGSAFRARFLPVTIFGASTNTSFAARAQAIRYAGGLDGAGNQVWRGADILSMSWNGAADASGNSALTAVQANGRNGKGCVVFASSGNNGSGYANFQLNVLTNLPAANYFLQFEYFKDVAGTGGYDTVWIGHVRLPDAGRTWLAFDSTNLPAGWSVGGNAPFAIEDDPEFAYGMGRYQARSGAIGNGQVSWIRTPVFTLVPTNMGFVSAWVDTERGVTSWNYPPVANEGDWFFVRAFNVSNAIWSTFGYEAGTPGNHQNVNDSAVATNAHGPSVQTNVMGVGGITDMGYRYDGSQYRLTGLEFVAPTAGGREGVWTTDRTGTNGYNEAAGTNGDYTAFSGTSAATPLAAGIGALLLSVDTNLTRSQVRARLRASCDPVGEVTYTAGTNLFYGYGRVNAYRALLTNELPTSAYASNDVVRNQREYFAAGTQTFGKAYTVEPSGVVTARVGDRVRLAPGFRAESGSVFRARIDPAL